MKTKIRTLITICALGLVGLNVSAANNYSTNKTLKAENSGLIQFFLNEDINTAVDFQREAREVTKWIADKEEAKAVQKLIDAGFTVLNEINTTAGEFESRLPVLNKETETTIDFQKEAQLETSLVADREEAKTIQKLTEEGRL